MDFEEVKRYIDKVKESDKFKELDDFTRMTQIKSNQDIYQNIKYYLSVFHARTDCEEFFQPDYEYFINFLEHYLNGKPAEVVLDDKGYIDLSKTLNLIRPPMFIGNNGSFIEYHRIFTDGTKYISKFPINYYGNRPIKNKNCLYAPLIASYIAKQIGIDTADIRLAHTYNGNRVLSKNILRPNEEIVTYTEDEDLSNIKISTELRKLEEALVLRKFQASEIERTKLDFLKQEFMAKLIGLKDQTMANSPLILSIDENRNRHIRMAPMLDFDYSFHIGYEVPDMVVRRCDNGQGDISSLIEQYKDYPGFEEFVIRSMKLFDISQVFENIFEDTKDSLFERGNCNEQIANFANFVNNNAESARKTIARIYENGREEK